MAVNSENVTSKGELFEPEIVKDLFTKVNGKSSLAKLADAKPVPFTGNEIFTFNMDDEVQIVGENEGKAAGRITVAPVKVVPVKIEYGARVSDEFMYASAEKKLEILEAFNDGYAKKVARGIDIMAFHRVNPRTGNTTDLIKAANAFDTAVPAENVVTFTTGDSMEDKVEEAIEKIVDYADVNGIAFSKTGASTLAKETDKHGNKKYPTLVWGGNPGTINGLNADVNSTVNFNGSKDMAITGDFNYFRWGYAKEIPFKVIEYGDPDGTGKDLQHYNQVYLRAETYVAFAIMDPKAFALVKAAE